MSMRYWAVIPAAGVGRRMGSEVPKQYLPLLDKTVMEWSLLPFLEDARIAAVMLVVAPDDTQWRQLPAIKHPKIRTTGGGAERADSVLAGLNALGDQAQSNDWVLVHDAARPCFTNDDLDVLIERLKDDPVGGLLAVPLTDTIKRGNAQHGVSGTVPRDGLWRALTPQMFRFALLRDALRAALAKQLTVTDESSAIEAASFTPRLIAGRADNFKITLPEDLQLAAKILATSTR